METIDIPAGIPAAVKAKIDAKDPELVDDFSYVSKVELCRADASGTAISGAKITWTSAADGTVTKGVLDGYTDSDCPADKVIELAANDCITRVNVVFDANGNGHSIIYRRRMGEAEESLGFGTVTDADLAADDVPAAGCLSGYNFGWSAPATTPTAGASRYGRNLAEANVVSLQGAVTFSTEGVMADLEVAEVGASATAIAQERIAVEAAAVAGTDDDKKSGGMGMGTIVIVVVVLGAIAGGAYFYML